MIATIFTILGYYLLTSLAICVFYCFICHYSPISAIKYRLYVVQKHFVNDSNSQEAIDAMNYMLTNMGNASIFFIYLSGMVLKPWWIVYLLFTDYMLK